MVVKDTKDWRDPGSTDSATLKDAASSGNEHSKQPGGVEHVRLVYNN